MKFSEIYKIGSGKPAHTDIPKGGLAIDLIDKRAYSKDSKGLIFPLSLSETEILDLIKKADGQVPIGGIIMFSGTLAKIPADWALCDGTNGTPNLVKQFVIGTNDQSLMGYKGGTADSIVPVHTHETLKHTHTGKTYPAGIHKHNITSFKQHHNGGSVDPAVTGTSVPAEYPHTDDAGEHQHNVDVYGSKSIVIKTGTNPKDQNLPPYIALAYIMRKR